MTETLWLRVPALRIRQSAQREVFSFPIDGKRLPEVAAVARVRRDAAGRIAGYQRPEVHKHISGIRRYIDTPDVMLPSSLVIAFDDRVQFEPAAADDPLGTPGELLIPYWPDADDIDKAGLIVDGQQRTAGIRDAQRASFPVFCSGFIARSADDQRSQFVLVNFAKPLPRRLIHELLPATDAELPDAMMRRRFPARLLDRLNQDDDSPLQGLIATPTTANGRFKDTSILKMLEASLTDGALYRYRDPATGEGSVDAMLTLLKGYWTAVQRTWTEAFMLPPRESRLSHGAGVLALGCVMDWLVDGPRQASTVDEFAASLEAITGVCAWTSGHWDFGHGRVRRWNELQNTGPDIRLLSDFLVAQVAAVEPVQPPAPAGVDRVSADDELVMLLAVDAAVAERRAAGDRASGGVRTEEVYAQLGERGWTHRAFMTRFGRLTRAGLLIERERGCFAVSALGRERLPGRAPMAA